MNKTYEIPNILEARDFQELRALMLQTNVKLGGKVLYTLYPPSGAKGRWRASYYEKVEFKEVIKKQLENIEKK